MEELAQWRITNRSLAIGHIQEYLADNYPAWEVHDGVFIHRESQVAIELPAASYPEGIEITRIACKIRQVEGHGGIMSHIRKCMWPHRVNLQDLNREAEVLRWAVNDRNRLARDDNRDFRDSIVEKAHLTGCLSIWLTVFQHDAQMIQDIKEYRNPSDRNT